MNYVRSRGLMSRKCKDGWRPSVMLLVTAACLAAAGSLPAQTVISNCTEQALRNALAGGGLVLFGRTCTNDISISSPIIVNGNVTLDAAGYRITLNGRGSNQIFTVNGQLKLVGINLVNGKAPYGGAVFVNSNATFSAQNCTFSGNFAEGPAGSAGVTGDNVSYGTGGKGGDGATGGAARGGAIYNYLGSVTLSGCKLLTNSATAGNGGRGGNGGNSAGSVGRGGDGGLGGAGGAAHGGAIYNAGDLTILNCTFSVNDVTGGNGGAGGTNGTAAFPGQTGAGGQGGASFGGAIYNAYNLSASGDAFSSNGAKGGNSAAGGTQTTGKGTRGLDGAPAGGGALANGWYGAITNCTFYADTARGGNGGNGGDGSGSIPRKGDGGNGGDGVGGGIQSWSNLNVAFCTLVSCGAYGGTNGVPGNGTFNGQNGLPGNGLGGNFAATSGGTTLLGTLMGWPAAGAAAYGTVVDDGYNMIPDNSISLGSQSFPNTAYPKLGAFGDHGGPTPTIPLLTNSPALDKVPADLGPATDQRGVPRGVDGGTGNTLSDIGAYELDAVSPPLIVQDLADTNAAAGSTVTLRIDAFGAQPLRYQWQLNGTELAGGTGSSYTVSNLSATNNGPYTVVITNAYGSATSSSATIHLYAGITQQPTNQVSGAGDTVSFTVTTVGDPQILYQWRFNGTNILTGQTSATLTLTNVQVAQVGSYTVAVTNQHGGMVSAPATLNLRPTILVQPANQTVQAGSPFGFSVTATGSPTLSYQWRLNGTGIAAATTSSLTNSSAQGTNAGNYAVVVVNPYGSVTSQVATLTVVAPAGGFVGEGTNGVPNTVISVTGPVTNGVLSTDSNGTFSTHFSQGTYTLTPSLTNYAFVPASVTITSPPGSNNILFKAYPLLRAVRTNGGKLELTAGGIAGLPYVLWMSSSLSNDMASWQAVDTNLAPVRFLQSPASNTATFYRLTR